MVQNSAGSGLGRFHEWWREAGLDPHIVRAYAEEPLGPAESLEDFAGLVLLGGGLLPDEDDRAPWLSRERELAGQAVDTGLPTLGICLGAQLLAHIGGGRVQPHHGTPEVGSTAIVRRDESAGDPLLGELPDTFHAIEHHVDAITALPADAVWLAESATCGIQAFRRGEHAWGVQFHPEVGAQRVAEWEPESVRRSGFDPDQVVATAQANEVSSAAACRSIAARFAEVVRRHASRSVTQAQ